MRASIITASLAFVSYAAAQGVAGLPTCAQKCLEPFADKNGIAGCKAVDIGCICSSGSFLNLIGCCLIDECSPADQQAAIAFASNICKSGGVTVPSEIKCDTAQTTSDAAALSSSLSSAVSSASSAISEIVSSRSASSESLASTLSSASSAATAATTSAGGAASSGASSAALAASSAASTGGASGYVAVGGSGVVGGIVAALALL